MDKVKSFRILMGAVFLISGLLICSPRIAGATLGPIIVSPPVVAGDTLVEVGSSLFPGTTMSDAVAFTMDNTTLGEGKIQQISALGEGGGENVTEEINFTFNPGTALDTFGTNFVYLIEPDQPYTAAGTDAAGTPLFYGTRSDKITIAVSHKSGSDTTTLKVTMNSDQDPGTSNQVTGYLENELFQDITAGIFGVDNHTFGGHYVQVLAASDTEVPIPPTALLLGSGLIGLAGLGWRRKRKS
jgi:hypothetical protein